MSEPKGVGKIGILGGTFDPIHFGHLNLALSLKEVHHLDEVFFIPAAMNPLKKGAETLGEKRKAMVELAIQQIQGFFCLDLELERPPPSYTVDTLISLKSRYPKASFHLLLGEDAFERIYEWKNPETILSFAPPLVGSRTGSENGEKIHQDGAVFTPIPLMEISSTDVRKRLKSKLFCGHLVPEKVLDFIAKNHLYSS